MKVSVLLVTVKFEVNCFHDRGLQRYNCFSRQSRFHSVDQLVKTSHILGLSFLFKMLDHLVRAQSKFCSLLGFDCWKN